MSKENVKAFNELASKVVEIRNRLFELYQPYEGKELTQEEKDKLTEVLVIPVAEEHGLPFTMEDWIAVAAESKTSCSEEELSEDILSAVSGGTASWVAPNKPRP